MKLGNVKWENAQSNSRLQPTQLGLGTSATDQSIWKVAYDYGTTDNNGNVKKQTISIPSITALEQTYAYDSLNRIKSATETQSSAQTWKQTFTYDRYGNRNFEAANTTTIPTGCSTAQCNPSIDAANNRFTTNQGYTRGGFCPASDRRCEFNSAQGGDRRDPRACRRENFRRRKTDDRSKIGRDRSDGR